MSKRKPKPVIVAFLLQGMPRVIVNTDEGDEPYCWPTIAEAGKWFRKYYGKHMGISAASSVVALNIDTGESELLL